MGGTRYRFLGVGGSYNETVYVDEGGFIASEDTPGAQRRVVRRNAMGGQEVELSKAEADRLLGLGAIEEVGKEKAPTGDDGGATFDVASATAEELVAFVAEAKVSEVVAAAGDDAVLAQRLLDAEDGATGQDPRKGVTDGLTKVIEKAEEIPPS